MNFEQLGDVLTDTGREVADKAKEMASIVRLKAKIKAEESKLKSDYTEIGKLFFEQNTEAPSEEYADRFASVEEHLETIEGYKKELELFKKGQVCPNCGKLNETDAAFCSSCGYRLDAEETEE